MVIKMTIMLGNKINHYTHLPHLILTTALRGVETVGEASEVLES